MSGSGGGSRLFGVLLSVGLTFATVFAIAVALDEATRRGPTYVLMAGVFGGAYLMLMRGPLGKAIARMLEGSSGHESTFDRSDDVDELMARNAEDRLRLMELEERLDFAERMLSQRHDASQLPLHRTPV